MYHHLCQTNFCSQIGLHHYGIQSQQQDDMQQQIFSLLGIPPLGTRETISSLTLGRGWTQAQYHSGDLRCP